MKVFLILNKQILVGVFLFLILTILIVGRFSSFTVKNCNADTHKKRVDYVNNLGYKIDENSALIKEIAIPYAFTDFYKEYNNIQKNAGFDLEKFKGKNAVLYTYNVSDAKNNTTRINLLVYNGVIIGGDIHNAITEEFLPLISKGNN